MAYYQFTTAALKEGEVWTWGYNGNGELGINDAGSRSSPVMVVGGHYIDKVTGTTGFHGLASWNITFGWGDATYGQIGDNTRTNKSSPVLVVGNHSFDQLSGGLHHAVALKDDDGSAWAWGYNNNGQLGDLSVTSKSSPVAVVGGHSFTKIDAGGYHTVGLKEDGSVWGWGGNSNGELGDNTTDNKSSPVMVVGNHSFVDVSIGNGNTFGLKANGEIWGCGSNLYGNIGDNTRTNRSSPVLVVGGHLFKMVAAGVYNCAGLKSNGEVWTWGSNSAYQLGNGNWDTGASVSSPVLVIGGHQFVEIKAGNAYFVARKENGEIWCWGSNTYGQLGDNTRTNRSSPVAVVGNHSFFDITGDGDITLWEGGWEYEETITPGLGINAAISDWPWLAEMGAEIGLEANLSDISEIYVLIEPGVGFNSAVASQQEYGLTISPFIGLNADHLTQYETTPTIIPGLGIEGGISGIKETAVVVAPGLGLDADADGFNWQQWLNTYRGRYVMRFYFTLTGDANGLEDLTIPISNFNYRLRAGTPSYLQVTVPDITLSAAIAARSSGDMKLEMAYEVSGVEHHREVLAWIDLESLAIYQGPTSQSLVLTGHRTGTFGADIVTVEGVTYFSETNGKRTIRTAAPDMYLKPGDTVKWGLESFTVDSIAVIAGSSQIFMDINE